ncbi:MAG: cytochrome c-type biogenesis CcmF C-terminal domain-containing protein, partial [Hylemonella sp.]
GKISVGPPYFDTVFMPLMTPVLFLMGVGPLARWKQAELPDLARRLRWALGAAVVAALLTGWLAGQIHLVATFGLLMTFWIVASVLTDLWERVRPQGAGAAQIWRKLRQIPRAAVGMLLAHLGMAAFCFGVVMVKGYEVERDVRMNLGDSTTLRGYTFTLRGLRDVRGPNYDAVQGLVQVTQNERQVAELKPEKRVYRVQQNPMTEAAIDVGLTRDLYVSLGEEVEGGAWIVRIYVKPFIDWIWGGCLLMALGGALAASDRRYRSRREPGTSA